MEAILHTIHCPLMILEFCEHKATILLGDDSREGSLPF